MSQNKATINVMHTFLTELNKFSKDYEVLNKASSLKTQELESSLRIANRDLISLKEQSPYIKVKSKIESVYRVTTQGVDYLKKTEDMIYPSRRWFASEFASAKAVYNKELFVEEIVKAYNNFNTIFPVTKNITLSNTRANVKRLAEQYAVICDIKNNVDKYISSYLGSSYEKKLDETQEKIKSIEKKIVAAKLESKEEISKNLKAGQEKLRSFVKSFENGKGAKSEIPNVNTSYSDVNMFLGFGEISLSNPDYKKYIPDNNSSLYRTECYLDLKQNSNLHICYSDKDEAYNIWNFIQWMIAHFVVSYPGNYKRVAALHDKSVGSGFVNAMSFLRKCSDNNALIFSKNKDKGFDSGYDMSATIDSISEIIDRRIAMLSNGKYNNILEYNENNTDNVQELVLLVIKDLDLFDTHRNLASRIVDIMKFGNQAGVYTVFIENEKNFNNLFSLLNQDINADSAVSYRFRLDKSDLKELSLGLVINTVKDDFSRTATSNRYAEKINENIKKCKNVLDFLEFHNSLANKARSDNYTLDLRIPIGKHGAEPVFMSMQSQSPAAHAIIEGKNGTGKTALLHSIVLSAAYHYSPEELEIFMFDFKRGGIDFEPYKLLKHVKYISVDSNDADALELLNYISSIVEKRGNIKGTRNPRTLIVIDEYSIMSYECEVKLEQMARQLRAYGGCLLLSSQDAPFDVVNSQMAHFFEMYKDSGYRFIENPGKYGNLTPTSRLAIYKGINTPVSLRFPFAGDAIYKSNERKHQNLDLTQGLGAVINTINNRYPHCVAKPIVFGEYKNLEFNQRNETKSAIISEDTIKVLLGRRALTNTDLYYKIDENNRLLLLVGNKKRASHVEYLIADALSKIKSKEPLVYYLNFSSYDDNAMAGFAESSPQTSTKRPVDIVEVLNKIYDVYMKRSDDILLYDEKVDNPIEVIVHCANKAETIFARLEEIERKKRSTQQSSYSSSFSFRRPSSDQLDALSDEELDRLEQQNQSSFDSYYDLEENSSQQLSPREIFQKLLKADEECKINFVLHFETVLGVDSTQIFPQEWSSYKDAIIIPTIPDEDEEPSVEETVNCLNKFGEAAQNFAESYREKMKVTSNNKAQVINNLKQLILVDERTPIQYLPYEK